jgi:hypothetical protein
LKRRKLLKLKIYSENFKTFEKISIMKFIKCFIVFLVIIYQVFGLPAEAFGSHQSGTNDDDDSDMLMEPNERQPQYSVIRSEPRAVYSTERNGGFVPIIPRYSRISRLVRPDPPVRAQPTIQAKTPIITAAEQKFYPYFRNSGPSRPFNRPTTAAAIAERYSVARSFDPAILGSGDFDVIQGGTFYPEGEHSVRQKINDYYPGGSNTFGIKNGHGRPNTQAFKGPRPYYPEDPFEHFRDFADINAGNDPAFSHFVVVYANKNATKPHPTHNNPRNIFEQLQLLDEEKKEDELAFPDDDDDDYVLEKTKYKKKSKLSKFKTKLAATKMEKKYKKKSSTKDKDFADYTDPLLAES